MKSTTEGQEERLFVCGKDKRLLRVSLSQPNTVYQQNIYTTVTQLLIETEISRIVTNKYFTFCPAKIVIWPTVPRSQHPLTPPNSTHTPAALNSFNSVSCILLLRKATLIWPKVYIFILFHLYMS